MESVPGAVATGFAKPNSLTNPVATAPGTDCMIARLVAREVLRTKTASTQTNVPPPPSLLWALQAAAPAARRAILQFNPPEMEPGQKWPGSPAFRVPSVRAQKSPTKFGIKQFSNYLASRPRQSEKSIRLEVTATVKKTNFVTLTCRFL